jgi:hypothetical protein
LSSLLYHPCERMSSLDLFSTTDRGLKRRINLFFIWLMAGLKPDHKTIAEFRRNNKEALKKALIQAE